jgi:hypothetical protein
MQLPALQIKDKYIGVDAPLRAFRLGESDQLGRNQRNLLREVGGLASQGDMAGAANTALAGGDIKTGMGLRDHTFKRKIDIEKLSMDKRLKAFQMITDGVKRANTPEKYSALIGTVSDIFGPDSVSGYEDYERRPDALTILEQAQLKLKNLQIKTAQGKLNAGAQGTLKQVGDQLLRVSPEGGVEVLHTAPPKAGDPLEQYLLDEIRGGGTVSAPMVPPTGPSPTQDVPLESVDGISVSQPSAPPVTDLAPQLDQVNETSAPSDEDRNAFQGMDKTQKLRFLLHMSGKSKAAEMLAPDGTAFDTGPYKDAKQIADVEAALRKEVASIGKEYFKVRDAFARVRASVGKETEAGLSGTPAGDLSLIFNFMKMQDPGSTVREGEFATAQNSAGVPGRIRSAYNYMVMGNRLNEEQRLDFFKTAENLFLEPKARFEKVQTQYRGMAERMGVNVENVIVDHGPIQINYDVAAIESRRKRSAERARGIVSAAQRALKGGKSREAVERVLRSKGVPVEFLDDPQFAPDVDPGGAVE